MFIQGAFLEEDISQDPQIYSGTAVPSSGGEEGLAYFDQGLLH